MEEDLKSEKLVHNLEKMGVLPVPNFFIDKMASLI